MGKQTFHPIKFIAVDFTIIILKLFPLKFQFPLFRFNLKNYQLVLAFVFAVEEINKDLRLLQNMTLGFDIYNVGINTWATLESPFIWLSGQDKYNPNYTCLKENKSVAVLTGVTTSAQTGTLLELYKLPQVRVEEQRD
jgi:hypothetical protein